MLAIRIVTMRSIRKKHFRQGGYTLVEMMIALSIGVFLTTGIIQLFISTKQTYRFEEALSRLQENGRFAMEYMSRDIRNADYNLCLSQPIKDATTNTRDGVTGLNGTPNTSNSALDLPDSIKVHWIEETCSQTRIDQYREWRVNSAKLYLNAESSERVEGVENMQITYGIDTNDDGTPNYYASAGTGVDLTQAVTVRISLLLRSIEDSVVSSPVSYTYNGGTYTPDDRRLRRIFTTTIALRNRIIS